MDAYESLALFGLRSKQLYEEKQPINHQLSKASNKQVTQNEVDEKSVLLHSGKLTWANRAASKLTEANRAASELKKAKRSTSKITEARENTVTEQRWEHDE